MCKSVTKRKWAENLSTLGLVCHGAHKKRSNHLRCQSNHAEMCTEQVDMEAFLSSNQYQVAIIATFFTVQMIETFSRNEKRNLGSCNQRNEEFCLINKH